MNNLNILTNNIAQMSVIQLNHLYNYNLFLNNNKLKYENTTYINEISNLKRKLTEYENTSECCTKKRSLDVSEINNLESKYKLIIYKPCPFSYSSKQIEQLILSIKSIDDIINLNNLWHEIKHNNILQRLYYLIPPLIKLNNMIGIKEIKNDIFKKIIYYTKNLFDKEYLHTIISGPPGVGKTEFAKIYGEIFVRLDILKTDNFIEIKRDDLVGEYLGSTSIKTKKN